MATTQDLGLVTSYGYAVAGGYRGSVEDRQYMFKEEALKYVKDLFNREADIIDQKYNDSNDEDNTIRYNP